MPKKIECIDAESGVLVALGWEKGTWGDGQQRTELQGRRVDTFLEICCTEWHPWLPLLRAALTHLLKGPILYVMCSCPQKTSGCANKKAKEHENILGCVGCGCTLDRGDGSLGVCRHSHSSHDIMCTSVCIADAFLKLVGKTGLQRTHTPQYNAAVLAEHP